MFRTPGKLLLMIVLLALPLAAHAYSVLSHEEVVDMAWTDQIVPLLKARYPGITDEQIKEAHSFAYGGSVIQDIGYYPFGDKQFSDLLHYVRTGEFVTALFRNAQSADDFAFACGALAHYFGDTVGHPYINEVTAKEYPKLAHRFGKSVTYFEDPTAHLRVEFGFDVVEVAHGRYSQDNYRDFIGFQVAKPLLEKAFQETYGVEVKSIMKHEDLAISTYRYSVSQLIPKMTKVALVSYKDEIQKENPTFDARKFEYRLRRTEFEKQYGNQYARPGFGAHLLAILLKIVPKVGPFRALQLSIPNAQEQDLYLKSVNSVVDAYKEKLTSMQGKKDSLPVMAELDMDTGKQTAGGEYPLADDTYAQLLETLTGNTKADVSPDLRADILAFYADGNAKNDVQKRPNDWAKVQASLTTLKASPASTPPSAVTPAGAQ